MAVTGNDGFSWVAPRVARREFIGYLQQHAADGVLSERDPGAYWDAIVARHVDPAFVLGIFTEESSCGNKGKATITHSWGNMRTGGDFEEIQSTGEYQGFASFPDWLTGCMATAAHLDTDLYRGLTISDAIHKWAPAADGNDPDHYTAVVLDVMNSLLDNANETDSQGGHMARVILSAGHLNIGQITDDHLGAGDAARLATQTGALGTEAVPNAAVRDAAAALLSRAGVDVVSTDAVYHADVYGEDADLCVFIHHDGVSFGNDHPQWSGAAVVTSGNPTDAANTTAQRFVDAWKADSPEITGITDTHVVTGDMTGYYGGWYRTANTPAALVECSIWGGADGQRPEVDTDKEAHAIAAAVAQALSIGGTADVSGVGTGSDPAGDGTGEGDAGTQPVAGTDSAGGWERQADGSTGRRFSIPNSGGRTFFVGHGFGEYYRAHGYPSDLGADADTDPSPLFGYPISDEFTLPGPDGVKTVQYFERARFEVGPQGTVQLGRVGSEAANRVDPVYRHLFFLG